MPRTLDLSEEGLFFGSIAKFIRSRIIIEIGVAYGRTTAHLCNAAEVTGGFVHGFDLWNVHGQQKQFSQISSKENVEKYLYDNEFHNFKLHKIDTFSNEFDDLLKQLFEKSKIDFAFIDADHSYIGIKNDFFKIYPYLSDTGVIAFHDTLRIDGCREFMIDLRTKYNDGTFDLIELPWGNGTRRVGIHVLVKRTYPVLGMTIDETCGSLSSIEDIYYKEKIWYIDELNKHKNNG